MVVCTGGNPITYQNQNPNPDYYNNRSGRPSNNRRNNNNQNRNYRPQSYNDGYGIVNQQPQQRQPRRSFQRRDIQAPRQQRNLSGQQRGPRQMRLNDYMPRQLRTLSPNTLDLPQDFNLASPTMVNNPRPVTPSNPLPQRPRFATQTIATNNSTQPFNVNENQDLPDQQRQPVFIRNQQTSTTTTSYRRRERRNRQQQYRQNEWISNNRFAPLDQDEPTDMESNYGDQIDEDVPIYNNNFRKKRINVKGQSNKKQRLYLEPNRILRYMQENAPASTSGRGNQAYVLAATAVYDDWVRNNYELQIWQAYLKMGTENKHWAKEVIQRTKKRDDIVNTRFVQKKIYRLTTDIARAGATVSDLQVEINTYWTQTIANTSSTTVPILPMATSNTSSNRPRDAVDRIEKAILKYIHQCTQHVKKMSENKVQLAKAQMEEFKALEDFEQIASPSQWNLHQLLKIKMKTWSTKNKNNRTAVKRVEYDLPPKFIEKVDLTFKVDESIISQEEAQGLYNHMRQITKEFRMQAMTLYVQSTTRELELLTSETKRMIEGFPRETDGEFDTEAGLAAFKQYNDLREKRFNLEADLAVYFLDEQRVEGEVKEQEEFIAPTLTRSLGEDFSLQQ